MFEGVTFIFPTSPKLRTFAVELITYKINFCMKAK